MIDPSNIDFDTLNLATPIVAQVAVSMVKAIATPVVAPLATPVVATKSKNSVIILLGIAAIVVGYYISYHYINFTNDGEKSR